MASTCDEPDWAAECIEKFAVGQGIHLKDIFGQKEIHSGEDLAEPPQVQTRCFQAPHTIYPTEDNHLYVIAEAYPVSLVS